LLPALEKERQRTLELSTEIASLDENNGKEAKIIKDENNNLRSADLFIFSLREAKIVWNI